MNFYMKMYKSLDNLHNVRYNVHIVILGGILNMTNTNLTNLRKNLFTYFEDCVKFNDVVSITGKNGNAVLMSEEDYRGLMATLEIYSVPGLKDKILEASNAPMSEFEELDIDEL